MPAGRPAAAFLLATLLLAAALPPAQASDAPGMRFGMGMGDVDALTALGAKPSFGMYWAGAWIQTHGWGGVDGALDKAYATGTTPVIQFWYWGDSISPTCVENGCYDALHDEHLSKASWYGMASTLASKIETRMKGREAIVIVESEFNKGGIDSSTYAPTFDAYLEQQMATLKKTSGVKVVIGFGNWGQDRWDRFPKAIAASDLLGFQTMRGSTRDSLASYQGAIDAVKGASSHLHSKFGKPTLLHDLALSSYPEPDYLAHQEAEVKELFARKAELAGVGLAGVVYRGLRDNPHMDLANYYGEAERHWGLRKADGTAKPSLQHWIAGAAPPKPPAPAIGSGLTVEAESFETKTTGGASTSGSPSGGSAWNVWSNGEIRQTVNASAGGAYDVTIRARGELAGDQLPRMVLKVDGVAVAAFDVGSTSFADHRATVDLAAGDRLVAVAFTNDYYGTLGDRNLVVDLLRIEPAAAPAPAPEPEPEPTPPPPAIALAAKAYKVKGFQRVDLSWSGATGTSVDVWRDGVRVAATANDGAHTDALNKKGGGAYAYRVCEAGTTTCSEEVHVAF